MIFLDNNSTTQLDERVLEKMLPYLREVYGNPHSNFHNYGLISRNAVEESRENIAYIFNVNHENVIFTSGATESNNLILKGLAYKALEKNSNRKQIFCSSIEHKCVLETCGFCETLGFKHHIIPVNKFGCVDKEWLENNIDEKTLFVSVMAVNNETGTRSNLEEINEVCKKFDVFFHSDMAQALHGETFDLTELNIDAISISGHKIYGPKGIGALILNHEPFENGVLFEKWLNEFNHKYLILNVKEEGLEATPVATVHDSIEIICPREEVQKTVEILYDEMVNYPTIKEVFNIHFDVPLAIDIEVGTSFGDVQEYNL